MQIDFGVESGSERIFKILSRKTPAREDRHRVRAARAVGASHLRHLHHRLARGEGGGHRGLLRARHDAAADYTAFYYATPYPGTKLYDMALAKNGSPTTPSTRTGCTASRTGRCSRSTSRAEELIALRSASPTRSSRATTSACATCPSTHGSLATALRYPHDPRAP